MQPDEGAPPAWLVFEAGVADALGDLRPGTEILVLTWLDRADRGVLLTIPRGDPRNPMTGVFSTRVPGPAQPHRPAPGPGDLGRRPAGSGGSPRGPDGTPVIDVKAVLEPGRRPVDAMSPDPRGSGLSLRRGSANQGPGLPRRSGRGSVWRSRGRNRAAAAATATAQRRPRRPAPARRRTPSRWRNRPRRRTPPSTAIPNTPPSSLIALFAPDAMPSWSRRTELSTTLATGAKNRDMPTPETTNAGPGSGRARWG